MEARIEIPTQEGGLDALVAAPGSAGRAAAVIVLAEPATAASLARRLAARGYFVLAPEFLQRCLEDRREDADAWLDYLAAQRRVDDTRVGAVGLGPGANLALRLAAWRSERIAASAAYGARGFGPQTARQLAQRINGVVRLGYPMGVTSPRAGALETALSAAGVDFDIEIYGPEPDWPGLLDLLGRALRYPRAEPTQPPGVIATRA
jgi:carboxymethylenebutenolidase